MMKKIIIALQLCLASLFPLFGQEIALSDILKAGRGSIEQIISKYSLSDSLSMHPYIGYWTGNSWIIVCDKPQLYVAYYGCFDESVLRIKQIHRDNQDLNLLFALTKDDFKYTEFDYSNSSWYYHYFVLYDASHSNWLECNSTMMKRIKKGRKRVLAPILPSSLFILWRIMMPEVSGTEEVPGKTSDVISYDKVELRQKR